MELSVKDSFIVCLLLTTICSLLYAYSYKTGETANATTIRPNKEGSTEIQAYGLTCKDKIRHGRDLTVIYNAMPKTGSRTFTNLCTRVIKSNLDEKKDKKTKKRKKKKKDFERAAVLLSSKNGSAIRRNTSQLRDYYESWKRRSVMLRGHNTFVQLPTPRFVYVNIIREPIPWIVSGYYYRMNGDGGIKQPNNLSQNFDECMLSNSASCVPPAATYLRYFCGELPGCDTEDALGIAKTNLDRFIFVGLTEEYLTSMRIFETLMPDVFGGLADAFIEDTAEMRERSRTVKKREPTNATIAALRNDRDVITMYEFYEYVRGRFEKLRSCLFDQDEQEEDAGPHRSSGKTKRKRQKTKGKKTKKKH